MEVRKININIISIGKNFAPWVNAGYKEYAERLPKNIALNLIEIATPKRTKNTNISNIIELEGKLILKSVPKGSLLIALDEHGTCFDTLGFARKMQGWIENHQDVSLVIGGPDGLAAEIVKSAKWIWSLSKLTFPHHLIRILVAEQIYRGWSVINRHPYHRGEGKE